ncbi:MAG: chromate transporter [Burkholderiales bacterium]|nr:chromate transporter [Burkholderiales bacterium]
MNNKASEQLHYPKSCWELYWSFSLMAMQAFGGSTAIAQQFLVDQKKWLDQKGFLELLTVSQVLPGPNIMILTTILGDRYFGWRGALASFLGMVSIPGTLMLTIYVVYEHYAQNEIVSAALMGMAASAAGMVVGAALRLVPDFMENPIGKLAWLVLLVITFVLVALYKISMLYVLPLVGIPAIIWAYYRIIRRAGEALKTIDLSKGEGDK